jgi:hypothetical protein
VRFSDCWLLKKDSTPCRYLVVSHLYISPHTLENCLDKGDLELIQHRATGWTTSVQFTVRSEAFLSFPLLPHWFYGPLSLQGSGYWNYFPAGKVVRA